MTFWHVSGVLTGDSVVSVFVAEDRISFASQIVFGAASFSLSYIILLIVSATMVLILCIALIVKLLLRYGLERQTVEQIA